MRAKVLSYKETKDNRNSDLTSGLNRKILRLRIEDVVKGAVDFVKQPEVEVFYRDWQEGPSEDFLIGESYLFYLYNEKPDDSYPFAINVLINYSGSRILIKDEGYSKNTKTHKNGIVSIWKEEKKQLVNTINTIKNMTESKNEK